jgi:hypothetical protein
VWRWPLLDRSNCMVLFENRRNRKLVTAAGVRELKASHPKAQNQSYNAYRHNPPSSLMTTSGHLYSHMTADGYNIPQLRITPSQSIVFSSSKTWRLYPSLLCYRNNANSRTCILVPQTAIPCRGVLTDLITGNAS